MVVKPDTPLTQFPGVGEVRAKKLSHLGLNTAGDLLTYYPRDYEDRRQVYAIRQAPEGVRVCVRAMVAQHPRLARIRKGLDLVQVPVVDQGGTLHLTFFNQSYVERALLPGEDYVFYGQVERQGNRLSMTNPVFERADRQDVTGRIVPVYPLTAGISSHLLSGLVRQALRPGDGGHPAPGGAPGPPPGGGGVCPHRHPLSPGRPGPGPGPAAAGL